MILKIELMNTLDIAIPAIISVVGFIITILTTKNSIARETKKKKNENLLEKFGSIEYDLAEILQLCTTEKLNLSQEEIMEQFPFYIVNNRGKNFNSSNTKEKIYCLSGYISTYGSKDAMHLFSLLQSSYDNDSNNFEYFPAIISLLYTQLRFDATNDYVDYHDWINIRFPFYNKKHIIFSECENILKKENIKSKPFLHSYNTPDIKRRCKGKNKTSK